MKKKCKNCGMELPEDSDFCQYCGSNDIEGVIPEPVVEKTAYNIKPTVFKRCIDCGRELPEDSDFCQYCGSKRVAVVNNVVKKDLDKESQSVKNYKKPFIAACVLCLLLGCGLGYGMYHNYRDYIEVCHLLEKTTSEKESLQSKLNTANKSLDSYRTKASKYDKVANTANQTIYSDFRTDTYFVKGTSKTVKVYCNFSGSYTVYPSVSGSGISISWGDWTGSGYNCYCPLYVKCSSSGYGTITLTNSNNSHEIIIYVSGS